MTNIRRYLLELILVTISLFLLISGTYIDLQAPVQVMVFKVLSVSIGLLHAHIAGKLLFPAVDWTATTMGANTYVRIALYVVVPFAYAIGG